MRRAGWLTAAWVGLALGFGVSPALADEETFIVNTPVDASDSVADNSCDADGSAGAPFVCTLRAAIQESNDADTGTDTDGILFDDPLFNGELLDTIDLGSSLPTINDDRLSISGTCSGGVPCAGIDSPGAGQNALTVSASNVSISRVSVTNANFGIFVTGGSPINEFKLFSSWLGIKLDGSAGPNSAGVFLDQNAQGAQLGDAADLSRRNVFGNSLCCGLRIFGADTTTVAANYFGVRADGTTSAQNGMNISVEGIGPDQATNNTLGGSLSPAEESSAACDGACNVISGAFGNGVSLAGVDGTTVAGNHVGLVASGTAAVPNGGNGIDLGEDDNTVVRANVITGGTRGIRSAAGANSTEIDANTIGTNAAGTTDLSPPAIGIDAGSTGSAANNEITDNRVAATSLGIFLDGAGGTVTGNTVGLGAGGQDLSGGNNGIFTFGNSQLIDSNTVANSTSAGILLRNLSGSSVSRNVLGPTAATGLAGDGIVIDDPISNGNGIGSVPTSANTISNVAGNPILITADAADQNSIGVNFGSGNGALFADLGDDGFGNVAVTGPNNGIQAPVVRSARRGKDKVKGTGTAGTTVRVYRSAGASGASPTGLVKYLGEAVVGAAGGWKLNPAGKLKTRWRVSANQTSTIGDSSEFARAKRVKP